MYASHQEPSPRTSSLRVLCCPRNLNYWDSVSTSGETCVCLSPDSLTLYFKSEGSVLPQEPELLGLGEHAGWGGSSLRILCCPRNLNYWDSVSTLAGEVPRPHKTVPRALGAAVVLVVVTYIGPLLVGLGVTTQVGDWKLGYFAYIAKEVGLLCLAARAGQDIAALRVGTGSWATLPTSPRRWAAAFPFSPFLFWTMRCISAVTAQVGEWKLGCFADIAKEVGQIQPLLTGQFWSLLQRPSRLVVAAAAEAQTDELKAEILLSASNVQTTNSTQEHRPVACRCHDCAMLSRWCVPGGGAPGWAG